MTVYNEFDTFAANWLENLIAAGELPPGKVDRRDICELKGTDCGETTHLFGGCGGWPLAIRLAEWPDNRPVWTGSCPCQPYSAAGKGKGDSDSRNLWPEMFRLIREYRPPICIGEQVASKDALRWVDGVRLDLENEGYAFAVADLCAASAGTEAEGWIVRGDQADWERIIVGAPHIRQRLFWVAVCGERDRRFPDPPRDSRSTADGLAISSSAERRGRTAGTGEDAYGFDDNPSIPSAVGWLGDAGEPRVRAEGHGEADGAPGGDPSQRNKRQRVRFNFGDAGPFTPEQQAIIAEHGYWPGPCPDCGAKPGEFHQGDCPGPHRLESGCSGDRPRDGTAIPSGTWIGWMGDTISAGREGRRAGLRGEPGDSGSGEPLAKASGCLDGLGYSDSSRGRQVDAEQQGRNQESAPWSEFLVIPCRDNKVRRISSECSDVPLAHGIPTKKSDERLGYLLARLVELGHSPAAAKRLVRDARSNRVGRLRGYGNAIVPVLAAEFIRAVMEVLP